MGGRARWDNVAEVEVFEGKIGELGEGGQGWGLIGWEDELLLSVLLAAAGTMLIIKPWSIERETYLSEQYSTELQGTIICFSQVVLRAVSDTIQLHTLTRVARTRTAKSSWP